MPLDEYHRKRDFTRTGEPAGDDELASPGPDPGEPPEDALSFVIHKHAARALHYDMRLELGGVLLSWAVPKGPSLDPSEKRLAVHVEDHPLEYGTFEGTIPPGEYGAGAVIVWDRGTWNPLGDGKSEVREEDSAADIAHAALEKGTLKFALQGEKLSGAWMLVRMKPRPHEKRDNWLLIKERDEHARPHGEYDVLAARPESVASGRTVEEVASAGEGLHSEAGDDSPADTPLQLATLSAAPPDGSQWLHEIKYDGYRLRIAIAGGAARVTTRGGEEWSDRFPRLAEAGRDLGATEAVLDGEAVVFGRRDVPDFGALQEALSAGDTSEVVYLAFDLLSLDGRDLRGEPLTERKRHLNELLASAPTAGPLRFADHVEGRGADFLEAACRLGLEGAVSKRSTGPYRPGRTPDWRKTKCTQRQEFVVVGATEPGGSRTGFGALLLGVYDDAGELHYAGRVGTGFSERGLSAISGILDELAATDPPAFASGEPPQVPKREIRWVRPELVAEVEFAEWTSADVLRQSRFIALREDRDPHSVRREESIPGPPATDRPATGDATATPASVRAPRLTNPNKPLFPGGDAPDGHPVTKADLVAYYRAVAAAMLPHLAWRPLSIVRCPHGRTGECFFQKHPDTRGWPVELPTFELVERDGETATYFLAEDAGSLASLVQLGTLEIHAWNSLSADPETPDRIVFDLDPGPGVTPDEVRSAAFTLRDTLTGLGLAAFPKTTGGLGLHVVVPLTPDPAVGYDEVRAFTRALVERLASAEPERFTGRMAKSARTNRIFIDYLRNAHGATAVAAYSTRARPGAPVAVPLTWEELAEEFDPRAFDIRTVPERLAHLAGRDPWSGYESARADLPGPKLE